MNVNEKTTCSSSKPVIQSYEKDRKHTRNESWIQGERFIYPHLQMKNKTNKNDRLFILVAFTDDEIMGLTKSYCAIGSGMSKSTFGGIKGWLLL